MHRRTDRKVLRNSTATQRDTIAGLVDKRASRVLREGGHSPLHS